MYYKHQSASSANPGSLILINPRTKSVTSIPVLNFPNKYKMNAHGISLYLNQTLYVLSHSYRYGGEILFLFDIEEYDQQIHATYVKAIKISDEHGIYNGISVFNRDYFYITQWMPFPDTPEGRDVSLLTTLYRFFLFAFTRTNGVKLCKVNGEEATCEFKDRGYMPNGIQNNGKNLFVADSVTKTVNIYEIKENLDIEIIATVQISHALDNLEYDNGRIYATGICKLIDYMKFSHTVKKNLPYHFVPGGSSRVELVDGKWVAEEIIMQNILNFPSTTVVVGENMVISSVIENSLMFCPAPKD